jgi:hypothetical protein
MAKSLLQKNQSKKSTLKLTCQLKSMNVSTDGVEATVETVVVAAIETDVTVAAIVVAIDAAEIGVTDVDDTNYKKQNTTSNQ